MGASHRTAARIVSRGVHNGKAAGPAGDGHARGHRQVMTGSLNCGHHRLVAGHGRLRDRPEERQQPGGRVPRQHRRLLRQPAHRVPRRDPAPHAGPGFNVGIVTTADLTDSTPAANAAHTSNRFAGPGIAAQFFDERKTNGVTRADGRRRAPLPAEGRGQRPDRRRNLVEEFAPPATSAAQRHRRPARSTCAVARRPGPARAVPRRRTWSSPSTRSVPAVTATNWRSRRTRRTATRRCSRT